MGSCSDTDIDSLTRYFQRNSFAVLCESNWSTVSANRLLTRYAHLSFSAPLFTNHFVWKMPIVLAARLRLSVKTGSVSGPRKPLPGTLPLPPQ